MRTTYIGGLKARHSPTGRETYRQRYCCQVSEIEVNCWYDKTFPLVTHKSGCLTLKIGMDCPSCYITMIF
ncbi:hypothetical protein F5X98DRAFT_344850 [Xylaria grammica]|nr:hypothetical protein F5X98DRAFT_344850 [Xylaria grammica]